MTPPSDQAAPEALRRLVTALAPAAPGEAPGPAAVAARAEHALSSTPWSGTAAVLALFGGGDDPDLILTRRTETLRDNPGQISFPGGGWEPGDADPVATALRETREEIGVEAGAIHVLGHLGGVEMRTRGEVVPVVGWWSGQIAESAVDHREVAAVLRWPVSRLVDPAIRVTATLAGGYRGPAWFLDDDFLWGFTAGIVDRLLRLGGWARPWDDSRTTPVPARFRRVGA